MNPLTGLVTGPTLLSYIEPLSTRDHNNIADCKNIATQYDSQGDLNIALYKLELSVDISRRVFFWDWDKRSARITQRKAFLKLNGCELDSKRVLIKKKLDEYPHAAVCLVQGH